MNAVLALVSAYLIGALPFSAWIARARGFDLREHGSGNLGATNVYRVVGWREALLALVLDIVKGTAAVLVAGKLVPDHGLVAALSGLAAVVGHMATPFAGFHGGKGVATGLGVFLGLAPVAALLGLLVWVAVLAFSGWVSLASGVAALALPPWLWATRDSIGDRFPYVFGLALFTAILVMVRHRSNWDRIAHGREQAIWERRPETPDGGAEPDAPLGGRS